MSPGPGGLSWPARALRSTVERAERNSNMTMEWPTDTELATTRRVVGIYLKAYGYQGTANAACDLMARIARRMAPYVAESAMDSGNTDSRPSVDPVEAEAWDLCALAHLFNAVAP